MSSNCPYFFITTFPAISEAVGKNPTAPFGVRPDNVYKTSMSSLPRLLCYGHDDLLLFTRCKILERDFFVESCSQISALEPILARGPIDIAVLCHSVPDAECQEVTHLLRQHSPAVKVLVLYESVPEVCTEESDKTMESLEGPSTLLKDVHALMEGRA
jgi:hypothetical protein